MLSFQPYWVLSSYKGTTGSFHKNELLLLEYIFLQWVGQSCDVPHVYNDNSKTWRHTFEHLWPLLWCRWLLGFAAIEKAIPSIVIYAISTTMEIYLEIFHNSTYLLESLPMMTLLLSSDKHDKDSPSLRVIDEGVLYTVIFVWHRNNEVGVTR